MWSALQSTSSEAIGGTGNDSLMVNYLVLAGVLHHSELTVCVYNWMVTVLNDDGTSCGGRYAAKESDATCDIARALLCTFM